VTWLTIRCRPLGENSAVDLSHKIPRTMFNWQQPFANAGQGGRLGSSGARRVPRSGYRVSCGRLKNPELPRNVVLGDGLAKPQAFP
jgi:hypothetical protein